MVLAEDLRQAVLQAALQGKLTKQLETDSDVDELLTNIQAEKEKLIADKKIKKEKSLPEIQEEEIPFDIPENWRWVRLGNLALYLDAGKSPDCVKENVKGDAWGVITTTAIQTNSFRENENKQLPNDFEVNKNFKIKVNDILITRAGPMSRTGIMCLVDSIKFNLLLSDKTVRVNINNENISKRFIVNAVNTPNIRMQVVNMMSGIDKQQVNISQEKIRNIIIPIPPIEEQQRIVDKINEIMPKIDEYEKMEKELEALKKEFPTNMRDALLQAAMQGKLTKQLASDSSVDELLEVIQNEKEILIAQKKIKKEKPLPDIEEDEIPFEIPENWRWVRLGDISTYGQSKEKIISKDIEPNMWVLDLEDIEKDTGKIVAKNKAENKKIAGDRVRFRKHDILYSKLRPYLMKILVAPEDGICTPEIVSFKLYGGMDVYYIMFILKSPFVNYAVNAETYGMKMPRVGTQTMLNMLIPIPPIEEQQRIVERLNALLPLCEDLKE